MVLLLSVFKPLGAPFEYEFRTARIFVCVVPRRITSAKNYARNTTGAPQSVCRRNELDPSQQANSRREGRDTDQFRLLCSVLPEAHGKACLCTLACLVPPSDSTFAASSSLKTWL